MCVRVQVVEVGHFRAVAMSNAMVEAVEAALHAYPDVPDICRMAQVRGRRGCQGAREGPLR
jgi:hypothetical protein